MTLEVSEIPKRFPADFENLPEVDRVDSALARLEGNYFENDFFAKIAEICGQHDVRQVEVLRHLPEILLHQVTLHQPERSVSVRDTDTEGQA